MYSEILLLEFVGIAIITLSILAVVGLRKNKKGLARLDKLDPKYKYDNAYWWAYRTTEVEVLIPIGIVMFIIGLGIIAMGLFGTEITIIDIIKNSTP
jgi:hypothetical protein